MQGANNPAVEIWITPQGEPVSLPYFSRGNTDEFTEPAATDIITQIEAGNL